MPPSRSALLRTSIQGSLREVFVQRAVFATIPSSTASTSAALGGGVGVGGVADVQDDVGFGDFFQRGAEGGDEFGGEFADEAHRVGQDGTRRPEGSFRPRMVGIQRGEELVARACTSAPVSALNRVDFPALV